MLRIIILISVLFVFSETHAQFNAKDKTETIDSIMSILEQRYVFPELANQFNLTIRESLKQKKYDTISSAESLHLLLLLICSK